MQLTSTQKRQKPAYHCVVGYDPITERVVFSRKIARSKIHLLDRFVQFESDDPEGYDAYSLSYSQALRLLELLECPKPPKRLDYFIEPWVPEEARSKA